MINYQLNLTPKQLLGILIAVRTHGVQQTEAVRKEYQDLYEDLVNSTDREGDVLIKAFGPHGFRD